jgi:hypothetical protein
MIYSSVLCRLAPQDEESRACIANRQKLDPFLSSVSALRRRAALGITSEMAVPEH